MDGVRAEVGWYRTVNLRANQAPDGAALEPDIIVNIPAELIRRLHETSDAYSATVDEITEHLRLTGQSTPPWPSREAHHG